MFYITLLLREIICKCHILFNPPISIKHIFNCHVSAAERVLMRSRQLVDVKKDDGFAALHLASLNGHVQV